MTGFLHLFRRELADHWTVFAAGLLFGLLPYALAPLAAPSAEDPAGVRVFIARLLVPFFLAGAAGLFGARWLVAGFGGRRAFELARPVTAGSLFASKLASILTIVLGGTLLAALPTGMAAWRVDRQVFETFLPRSLGRNPEAAWLAYTHVLDLDPNAPGAGWQARLALFLTAAIAALALLVLAQMVAFAVTDASWLSLADLGAAFVLVLALGVAYVRFRIADAMGVGLSGLLPLGLLISLAGLAGAWSSFRAGAIRQAHRRHALLANLGLAVVALVVFSASREGTRPDPAKLETFQYAVPNADFSRWILAGSQDEHGFEPVLVVDPARRTFIYLGARSWVPGVPWLSPDSRQVFARQPFGSLRVWTLGDSSVIELRERRFDEASDAAPAIDPHRLALAGGRALELDDALRIDGQREWVFTDAAGSRLGSFLTDSSFEPIGEMRPGMLLMGTPPRGAEDDETWRRQVQEKPATYLHTLVVEVPSGKVLRRLDGYLPTRQAAAGPRAWLIDQDLVPYDLDSPTAEPRPFLPWRPRKAARS